MVEVAVIGAGAAGLVAARHLLRAGLRAAVFDSRLFVGGAWSASSHNGVSTSSASMVNHQEPPQMWDNLTPNLSKFTCCFSDMMWPEETPTFPTLGNMKSHLDDYAAKFVLNDNGCSMHLGCTVTSVSRSATSSSQYSVEWDSLYGGSNSKVFDGVVVATGFFSTPHWPDGLQSWLDRETNDVVTRRILHSSQYRSPKPFANETVAVIGSSFSAHEIASDLRRRGANRVVNIVGDDMNRIPYVVPHYVPANNANGGGFAPIDCVLYQRKNPEPKVPEIIEMSADECEKRHSILREWIGQRKLQQAAAVGLAMGQQSVSSPPLVSISEDYLNLAIDRKIEIVRGRLRSLKRRSNNEKGDVSGSGFDVELTDDTIIHGVDRIIACTGFKSCLDFLSPEICSTLQHDKSDNFSPLIACYDAVHPNLAHFGLVGMYKGPYFGVMELQARLIAGLISGKVHQLSEATMARTLAASRAIRNGKPRAQFPHFDYIGMMDSLAAELDVTPDPEFRSEGTMVAPCFYQEDAEVATVGKRLIDDVIRRRSENIGRTVLGALVGRWSFERSIHCKLTSSDQRVHGTIVFSLSGPQLDNLRYREDGFLELPNGSRLEVFREYEYRAQSDMLNIHFIEDGQPAHLFLGLQFNEENSSAWTATSDHLCINDLYKGNFVIKLDGLSATEVFMKYNVKGPNKNYESVSRLQPLQ